MLIIDGNGKGRSCKGVSGILLTFNKHVTSESNCCFVELIFAICFWKNIQLKFRIRGVRSGLKVELRNFASADLLVQHQYFTRLKDTDIRLPLFM